MVPRPFIIIGIVIVVLACIPPAIIARMRAVPSPLPRIHYIQDMDNQHRLEAQQESPRYGAMPLFADGRAMRPLVPGTVARGELRDDDHYDRGIVGGDWATTFPAQLTIDRAFLERGQERFGIYCSPCHGLAGYGDGLVNAKANELLSMPALNNGTTWVAPKNLHEAAIRDQPIGQTFNTITNGVRNMSGYAAQVPVEDRWAIVSYVKALQRSQNARSSDVADTDSLDVIEVDAPGADAEAEE
jgi:mono/diheme cytochrome c family protein